MGTYSKKLSTWATKPVAWLTTVSGILVVLVTATSTKPLAEHVPAGVTGWLGAASALVIGILGVLTHGKVTPVAKPQTNDGTALVPADSLAAGRYGASGPAAGCQGSSVPPGQ